MSWPNNNSTDCKTGPVFIFPHLLVNLFNPYFLWMGGALVQVDLPFPKEDFLVMCAGTICHIMATICYTIQSQMTDRAHWYTLKYLEEHD